MHNQEAVEEGTCNMSEVVIRFFKNVLPKAVDGKLGLYYLDIIDYSLHKLIFYMGHSVRCKVQQVRIKEMLALSKGDTVTIIIDYMMKWEEERAR